MRLTVGMAHRTSGVYQYSRTDYRITLHPINVKFFQAKTAALF